MRLLRSSRQGWDCGLTSRLARNRTKDLAFLNNWKYKLGAEILTPFGREQLFALGVSFRTKYGHLLQAPSFPADVNVEGKKEDRKLVFRTETQGESLAKVTLASERSAGSLNGYPGARLTSDRMLKSALNFAAGFFGIPFESQVSPRGDWALGQTLDKCTLSRAAVPPTRHH